MQLTRLLLPILFTFGGLQAMDAALIVQQRNWGPISPTFDSATSPALDPLTFDQFDPSLGELQSVTIFMQVDFDGGNAVFDEDGVDPSTVTIQFGAEVDYSSSHVTLVNTPFDAEWTTVQASNIEVFNGVGGNDGDPQGSFQDDGGLDNGSMTILPASGSSSGTINPVFHSDYTGAGTYDINIAGTTLLNISSTGSAAGSFAPGIADGHVIITYDYIAVVPEPTSLALLAGSALFGLRRRRSAAG